MISAIPKKKALFYGCLAALLAASQLSSVQAQGVNRGTSNRGTANRGTSNRSGSGGASAREYNNNTMVGEAMISSDPETRRLIVITDEETNLQISNVIAKLDRPKPQVLIKVLFLEVTHRNSLDLGADAKLTHKINASTSGELSSVLGNAAQTSGGFYKLAGEDFQVTLRALAEAGKTEVLSRPTILARNNQQATIVIGQEVPFITNTRITDTGQTLNTLEYRDVGIILRVTPFISSEGMVEMIVAPEISNLTDRTVPISDTVSSPVIAKRSAETVVVTPDGMTVAIGGLMENNKTTSERKIPLLGDIPYLGALFKRKITENTKTELLIFLTPYVVQNPAQLANVSSTETTKSEMIRKTFTEKDLEKYLDNLPKGTPLPQPEPEAPAKKKK